MIHFNHFKNESLRKFITSEMDHFEIDHFANGSLWKFARYKNFEVTIFLSDPFCLSDTLKFINTCSKFFVSKNSRFGNEPLVWYPCLIWNEQRIRRSCVENDPRKNEFVSKGSKIKKNHSNCHRDSSWCSTQKNY